MLNPLKSENGVNLTKLFGWIVCVGLLYLYFQVGQAIFSEDSGAPKVTASGKLDPFRDPYQKKTSGGKAFYNGRLNFLAKYDITARVLDKEYYSDGKKAKIAPLDLTMGWKNMSVPSVYNKLNVRNSGRWYRYNWSGAPPIPPSKIATNSANMHIIPANDRVRNDLKSVRKGQIVRMQGYLVHYKEESAQSWWAWKSSTSRHDTGDGACELMYVENIYF